MAEQIIPEAVIHAKLRKYLDAYSLGFDWATAHCGHFAGGWVAAMTGTDPLHGLHARTARDWRRLIAEAGGIVPLISRQLGYAPMPTPTSAWPGDIVLLPGLITGGTLGICIGNAVAFASDCGAPAVHMPIKHAIAAWYIEARK